MRPHEPRKEGSDRLHFSSQPNQTLAVLLCLVLPALFAERAAAASHRLSQGLPFSDAGDAPKLSSDGRFLVYLHDAGVDEARELWSVPLAGGAPVRLSGLLPSGETVRDFEISANSQRVVYRAPQETPGEIELYSIPIAGPEGAWIRLNGDLPVGGNVRYLRISPDSSWVVYVADQHAQGEFDVWSVPIDGGTTARLRPFITIVGSTAEEFTTIRISPDSEWVLYRANFANLGNWELWRARVDGTGGVVRLNGTMVSGGDIASAGFSHDGTRVVYVGEQEAPAVLELYSVALAGGTPVKLNATLPANSDVHGFSISPDDSRVTYRVGDDSYATDELYSVPLAGGARIKLNGALAPGGGVLDHEIASDSTRVVYRADQQTDEVSEVYSVPLAGGAALKLNGALPEGGEVFDFAISPDGARVVYNAEQQTEFVRELYSVPIAGGTPFRVSDDLIAGGGVSQFAIAPGSDFVFYVADMVTNNANELFRGEIAGGALADVRMSGTLVPGGGVFVNSTSLVLHPDGRQAIYRADQEVDNQYELYVGDPCLLCDGFEAGDSGRWD